MDKASDEELMERFRRGDEGVFDILFDRFAPAIRGFLRQMVGDATLADDLTQSTFLSVVRSRDRYRTGSLVRSWFFAIAANAARDALRRRLVERSEAPALAEQLSGNAEPSHADPGLQRELKAALMVLPESQREAVILNKVQGLPFEEV